MLTATIGTFDGVHIGHRYLLKQVKEQAHALSMPSCVITFNNHPRWIVSGKHSPLLLTTSPEKQRIFTNLGIDHIVALDFTPALAAMTADDFLALLQRDYGVTALIMGYNHRFGHQTNLTPADYKALGNKHGVKIITANQFTLNGEQVNSSAIRRLISTGDVDTAANLLGQHYQLTGTVVHGNHYGSTIGFPTANIGNIDTDKLLPANGAYAVTANINGNTLNAMANIGVRPTINGEQQLSVEVNIFNFNDNIYGKELTINFIQRVRNERKFPSLTQLASQLQLDRLTAQKILDNK